MKSNLYLKKYIRRSNIDRIEKLNNIYFEKIKPGFENIDKKAEKYKEETFDKLMSDSVDDDDLYYINEFAIGEAVSFYEDMKIANYNLLLMFISMLYQIWEQQVRKFLFNELKNNFTIEFKDFCNDSLQIIKIFKKHNFDIKNLSCFNKINELRLLTNVIKHGAGQSSEELRNINPELFKKSELFSRLELEISYSTLLDETLNVNEADFRIYSDKLIQFWRELPEKLMSNNYKNIEELLS